MPLQFLKWLIFCKSFFSYLAVTRPVQYHINVTASGASPWRRVMRYMIPTVLFR